MKFASSRYPQQTPEGQAFKDCNDSTVKHARPSRSSIIATMQGSVLPLERYRIVGRSVSEATK